MESNRGVISESLNITHSSVISQGVWILVFAGLTAAASRFEIPSQPVPFTLQTLAVLLAGAFLGPRNGFLSQTVYLTAGCAGLPVFAAGKLGLPVLFGPTGGYLLAFPVAAFLVGWLLPQKRGLLWRLFTFGTGLMVIFLLGAVQLNFVYFHNISDSLAAGFLIFSWWDALKLVAATVITSAYRRGPSAS